MITNGYRPCWLATGTAGRGTFPFFNPTSNWRHKFGKELIYDEDSRPMQRQRTRRKRCVRELGMPNNTRSKKYLYVNLCYKVFLTRGLNFFFSRLSRTATYKQCHMLRQENVDEKKISTKRRGWLEIMPARSAYYFIV